MLDTELSLRQIPFNPDMNYYHYPYLIDEQTEALKG